MTLSEISKAHEEDKQRKNWSVDYGCIMEREAALLSLLKRSRPFVAICSKSVTATGSYGTSNKATDLLEDLK